MGSFQRAGSRPGWGAESRRGGAVGRSHPKQYSDTAESYPTLLSQGIELPRLLCSKHQKVQEAGGRTWKFRKAGEGIVSDRPGGGVGCGGRE